MENQSSIGVNRVRLLLIGFVIAACSYSSLPIEEMFQSKGIITGPDMRLCPSPCCSGWDIIIDQKTYNFQNLPANSGIDLDKEAFPLKVKLNWKHDPFGCTLIDVLQIEIDK